MTTEVDNSIVVVGQGYVGLPLAIALAKVRKKVFGVDVDLQRVRMLSEGESPTPDVTSEDLKAVLSDESYIPTQDFSVIRESRTVIICVPTPLANDGQPDLDSLTLAISSIKEHVAPGTLIVSESTSYPGTLRWVHDQFLDLEIVRSLHFAVAPERINPSDHKWNLANTTRVIGATHETSLIKAIELYNQICDKIIPVESPEIAEFAKLFENTFRLVNISLVNEMRELSLAINVDFRKVLDAAETKPYGFMRFNPSAGVGGHCIPVDPMYLQYAFENKGVKSEFINLAINQNKKTAHWICEKVRSEITEGKILIVGVAYKPNVGDTRESAAHEIASLLEQQGFEIRWTDNLVGAWEKYEKWNEIEKCNLALVLVRHDSQSLRNVLQNTEIVLDASGQIEDVQKELISEDLRVIRI